MMSILLLSQGGGLVIQGRALLVAPAVSRTEAESQKAGKKVKEQKDTRNLFLAREGCELLENTLLP